MSRWSIPSHSQNSYTILEIYQIKAQHRRLRQFTQPALLLRQVGGFDAVAGTQLLDGFGQVVANGAFRQIEPAATSAMQAPPAEAASSLAGASLTRKHISSTAKMTL